MRPKIILIMSPCLASGIYSLVFSISQLDATAHVAQLQALPGTRASGRERSPGFKPVANQSIWKSLWYLRCGNTLGNVWSCFWGCRRPSGFFFFLILKKALLWETKNCYQSIEQVPFGSFQRHYPDIFLCQGCQEDWSPGTHSWHSNTVALTIVSLIAQPLS